jgi:acetate---CoA ligase (ADP-forming) subunit beta
MGGRSIVPRGNRHDAVARILRGALARRDRSLSEHDSKRVIAAYGVPVTREVLVATLSGARAAARRIGYPVVLKVCGAGATHKTEQGLVAVGLASDRELRRAFAALAERAGGGDGVKFLVQEMVAGSRELMVGMVRDAQFGPSVMFGLGGIFTEIFADVVFRVAPLTGEEALGMLDAIRARRILDAVRGMKAVDRRVISESLVAMGRIALDHPDVAEIDVNPLIVRDGTPVAVDALVVLRAAQPEA